MNLTSLRSRLDLRVLLQWPVLLALSGVFTFLALRLQIPAEAMFGPLVASLIFALSGRSRVKVPPLFYVWAQAVIGLHLSARFDGAALKPALHGWWMILLITLVTTAGSVGLGLLFGKLMRIHASTAAMGMIAGGSAGIVATSDSLGADPRLVTYMQYLRLVLVVLATPLVVKLMGGHLHFVGTVDPEVGGHGTGVLLWDALIAMGIIIGGGYLGVRSRFPGGALIFPLVLGVLAASVLHLHGVWLPEVATEASFAVFGWYIGLQFDPQAVRTMARFTPALVGFVLVMMAVSAILGVILARVIGVDLMTGYLATTPGGINAVTVTSMSAGTNTTLVVAVQTVRLLATLLLGPPLVSWWTRRMNTSAPQPA
jgi:membrane AbrB-like protein